MKKKGLIISTVVMVVVLIASLTTATYAWFNAAAAATVSDIHFKVTSDSNLVIGVTADNSWQETPAWGSYYSDNTVFTPNESGRGSWAGDTNGLGMSINTGLDLQNITQAVYSFTSSTDETTGTTTYTQSAYTKPYDTNPTGEGVDEFSVTAGMKWADGAKIMKATGAGTEATSAWTNVVMNGNPAENVKGDYLDIVFGVAAAKEDVVRGFGCLITIHNTNGLQSVGASAALHCIYSLDGTTYVEKDIYGQYTGGDSITSMPATLAAPTSTVADTEYAYESGITTAQGDATLWIPLYTATSATDFAVTGATGIKQLHLIIYLCGPDGDCSLAIPAESTISIEFLAIDTETPAVGA